MKTVFIFLTCLLLSGLSLFAQVGINLDNSAPDPSAMLDVKSTNQGLLIPRMSTNSRNLIPSPATGLIIYNSTTNQINYFDGSYWHQLESTFVSSTIGTVNPGGGVSINVSPEVLPENSAILDVNNPTRGILMPRTTTDLIATPTNGLIIFNINTSLLSYYDGSQWISLCAITTGIPGLSGSQAAIGVAIKTDNSGPHQSAMLDISATDKGVLIPRLTNAERDAVLPATGLVVYNTSSKTIDFYNGSGWYQLISYHLSSPLAGIHVPSTTQIEWNWNAVTGATGYRWSAIDDFVYATDLGMATSTTESGLFCNTPYTRYAWAYNACGHSIPLTMNQTTSACTTICGQSITDNRDGKTYNTALIGSQCWMAENLNVGARIDGAINQTNQNTIEKYCYTNDEADCDEYGGLYQWDNLMQWSTVPGVQGICPVGWHVPTDEEWTTLTDFLGGVTVAGGKMKETGFIHWRSPNTGATNESAFTGLPGGYRVFNGVFNDQCYAGVFWCSSEINTSGSWSIALSYVSEMAIRSPYNKLIGLSVRCIMDNLE